MDKIAIILPHQDDELGIFNFLDKNRNNSKNIFFIYLTSGTFIKSNISKIRNLESIKVLKKFNIPKKNILFLGDELNIFDQKLYTKYNKVIPFLKRHLKKIKANVVISPIWEGGHPDHDATFLISKYLIRQLKIKKFFQFPLYNKKKYFFFNILEFNSHRNFRYKKNLYNLKKGLKYFLNIYIYKSQRLTFFILFQSLLFHFLIKKYEILAKYNGLPLNKPQRGKLWYEKRYKFTYKNFKSKSIHIY